VAGAARQRRANQPRRFGAGAGALAAAAAAFSFDAIQLIHS
jgi:hypothetical protein